MGKNKQAAHARANFALPIYESDNTEAHSSQAQGVTHKIRYYLISPRTGRSHKKQHQLLPHWSIMGSSWLRQWQVLEDSPYST